MKKRINDLIEKSNENVNQLEIVFDEDKITFGLDNDKTVMVYIEDGIINSIDFNSQNDLDDVLKTVEKSTTLQEILTGVGVKLDELKDWFEE